MRPLFDRAGMQRAKRWVDLVYPPRCGVCGSFLSWGEAEEICPECLSGMHRVRSPLCRHCGVPFEAGPDEDRFCERCLREPPSYEIARSLFVYEGTVVEAVHRLKYAGKTRLADIFGPQLAGPARACLPPSADPLVMPVPLHLERLRERGFNQSLLLSRHVARETGFDLDWLSLRRTRPTPSQATLGKGRRRENVRDAFAVDAPAAVQGRDVLLVDDVSTTGSTLEACSRALLQSGVERVFGLTLARAPARRS